MRRRLLALSSAVALALSVIPAVAGAQRAWPRHCDRYSYDCDWSDRMSERAFDRAQRSRDRAEGRTARAQDRAEARQTRTESRAFAGRPDDLARRADREMRTRERAEIRRERAVRVRRMRLDW